MLLAQPGKVDDPSVHDIALVAPEFSAICMKMGKVAGGYDCGVSSVWRERYLLERGWAVARIIRGNFSNGERGDLDPGISSIACLNLSPEPGDVRANLLMVEEAIRAARREEPALRWVVLPELVTCGYSDLESVHRFAEDADTGESARFFAALARDLGVCLHSLWLPGGGRRVRGRRV